MEVATELSPLSGSDTQCKITERTSYYPQEPNKRPKTRQEKIRSCFRHNSLTILTVVGVFGGVILGIILRNVRSQGWTRREIMYINYLGDLFLRMLKSLILPLIISSLVSAIGSLDLSLSGKIGMRAIVYYMVTTVSAVILGIILVISIQPGVGNDPDIKPKERSQNVSTIDTLMDLIRNMFPPNLVEACISQHRTEMQKPANSTSDNMDDWEPVQRSVPGMNIMGLVVFATVLGITLGKMQEQGKPLLLFFESLSGAMMLITHWVIWLSPVGVFFLVASKITDMQSLDEVVAQLGMYFLTVLIGLFIHGFIVLPLLYFVITKKNPFRYISNLAQALVTAFGTSSSSATLPIAINCLEERNNVDPRITRFVLPIGATINMDGTALYEAVAAIFIAQVRQVSLSFGQLVAVSITATAASIGAAGIPQAGLVTMVMVLDTVRLPADDVFLVIAVDWLLDRCRTTVNVVGDSLGAGIVNYLSRNELASLPHNTQAQNGADHHTTTSI
ncbi:excitatory amino acid transporter 1-like isoform X1 [Bombus vosnesenskii]|uniref:Amino acid transporter n=4 Tax=Pyrobombus TaxID=144703 RepID=A0A6J3KP17_9HYME|nr:excitatory amino acid transporter 1-like isoform X1 [Bombus vancouverensis nearcticus]XP_033206887.1 excitatory amino acid transporter 1-like isoform X1 [Bombus vancouverensis nearcticus]XP_033206888.1 excitatory amino acid transporter 1-like isoform X1 [Bombus vancouverensis nearcticus]XP_033315657.1 excitatory amino acid transporter 1-like isoform X1 [Bombus bifarius]XP_033315658.1 excitatory amino acid transporter 1-like isoform X1 [Bombus bifarius]XP_033315659.1 excitatory amino acid tr